MSECKDAPRKELISEINQCHLEQEKYEKELFELQAQVAVLRGALETATDYLYNPFEPDNQCAQYKNIKNILQTTPSEAYERVRNLFAVLELASNCLLEGSAIKNKVEQSLSEWRHDKCSS